MGKPEKSQKPEASVVASCIAQGCKTKEDRFGFCATHYDHYKFGLINKTGKPVPDYEKKFEHYVAYTKQRGIQKVA